MVLPCGLILDSPWGSDPAFQPIQWPASCSQSRAKKCVSPWANKSDRKQVCGPPPERQALAPHSWRRATKRGGEGMARPTFFQRVKHEKESRGDLAAEVVATSGGEKTFSCLQGGTCGNVCPVSAHMDSAPQADSTSRGDLSPPLSCPGLGESVPGDAQARGPHCARTKGKQALDHGAHIGSGLLHAWFCRPLPALASPGLWCPGSGAPRTAGLELLFIISL